MLVEDLAAGWRRKLLPLDVVEIVALAALHDRDDGGDDGRDERDLHQLLDEAALLLVGLFGGGIISLGDALLPGVGLDGLEPSTSSLSGKRSNRAELQAPGARTGAMSP